MMKEAMLLKVEGVAKSFATKLVLQCVDLDVCAHDVVAVLGLNGAGKTTLIQIITGLLAADSGRILLDGVDISKEPLHVRCRRGIGYLPQDSRSFEELTVSDNVRGLLECLSLDHEELERRLIRLLEMMSLQDLSGQVYGSLSGGEQRRVEIAKSLVRDPRLLILDEPFAALDPKSIASTCHHIRELARSGIGVLLADHRYEYVMKVATYVIILDGGCVVAAGRPDEVLNDSEAKRAYFAWDESSSDWLPS
jgi:lipopolysaccharide export system ATP-binding protein